MPREFKITNNLLAHMYDLRLWYISYAPVKTHSLERMQEMNLLDNEIDY